MKQFVYSPLVLVILSMLMGLIGCTCGEKSPGLPSEKSLPEPVEGVYITPTGIEAKPGQEIKFEIKIKPSGWGVSGCEINLSFNGRIMEETEIEFGDFLGSHPIVGLKQVDNQDGVLKLALARVGKTPVPSPPGVLAAVKCKILDSASSGTYHLEFTKVGLADEYFQDITNIKIQGTTINVGR